MNEGQMIDMCERLAKRFQGTTLEWVPEKREGRGAFMYVPDEERGREIAKAVREELIKAELECLRK